MKATKQDMIDLLQETISIYSGDPAKTRALFCAAIGNAEVAVVGDACSYQTKDGRECAIGVHADDEEIEAIKDLPMGVAALANIPKDLESFDAIFLTQIQSLHDNTYNWDSENGGLSERGWQRVTTILDHIEDGVWG